jgi:hypothetical protein
MERGSLAVWLMVVELTMQAVDKSGVVQFMEYHMRMADTVLKKVIYMMLKM